MTENHNYDHGEQIPYDNVRIAKDVVIEDFVWLGSRVTILPGTHIGRGAIIQAGSVVHGYIPECAIAGGNPARVFKYRDKDHFYELLEKKQFF
ncbi:MAG: acyltransferase [Bacteroides fragilis]|nr:acyltransferase [Bacteroides fragilis]